MAINEKNRPIFSEIKECRLCACRKLKNVLDLGVQPPANSLRMIPNEQEYRAPLKLIWCSECFGVQLSVTVDPEFLFGEYVWVTGTSATAKSYSQLYCDEVLRRVSVEAPFVVEIASNDGTFLNKFQERGCSVLGIDPARNIASIANQLGIPTLTEFFDEKIANKILLDFKKPDLIMARNVIPHVKEIHSIVKGMADLAGEDGIVVIEFHHAKKIVEELHYDSIYHEHLFYFSLETLSKLFSQYGLHAFDIFSSPISGGSLVLFLSAEKRSKSKALQDLVENESSCKLNEYETWTNFGLNSTKHAFLLKEIISDYAKQKPLVAYGASARSSTLMNFAGITNHQIEYVIDRNSVKHGLFTPGTNIPIISYDEGIARLENKNLLLLAWNFEDEIVKDLRDCGFEGDIIIPLPNEPRIR
jgi:hypothetical protein